ncbi:MAG TPA: hypothetical protein DCL49_01445, partial [Candidatus Omnitrophica bacterium]|nr:hypothetical protein [Candidatus Omnitrophota bacterium]
FAPAMETQMYKDEATQDNVRALKSFKTKRHFFIGPQEGLLASGEMGFGRMSEPASILSYAALILSDRPYDFRESLKEVLMDKARASLSPPHCLNVLAGNSNTKDSAGLVIITRKEGKYFIPLIQRGGRLRGWPGLWALPAGKRDGCEDILETAIRETKEEIGVKIAEGDILGGLPYVFTDDHRYKIALFMAMVEKELFFKINKEEADDFELVALEDFFKERMCVRRLIIGNRFKRMGAALGWTARKVAKAFKWPSFISSLLKEWLRKRTILKEMPLGPANQKIKRQIRKLIAAAICVRI